MSNQTNYFAYDFNNLKTMFNSMDKWLSFILIDENRFEESCGPQMDRQKHWFSRPKRKILGAGPKKVRLELI